VDPPGRCSSAPRREGAGGWFEQVTRGNHLAQALFGREAGPDEDAAGAPWNRIWIAGAAPAAGRYGRFRRELAFSGGHSRMTKLAR